MALGKRQRWWLGRPPTRGQYGQPVRLFRYIRFARPFKLVFRHYGQSPEDKQRMLMDVIRLTEAKSLPLDGEWVRGTAAESLRRHAPDRYARSRQFAAGFAARCPAAVSSWCTAWGTCSRSRCGRNWSARSTGTRSAAGDASRAA